MYRPIPQEHWVTKTIRKVVPADFVGTDQSNYSKVVRTEKLEFKASNAVDWIQECKQTDLVNKRIMKIELIDCLNSTFQSLNSNIVEIKEVKKFAKVSIKRHLNIESDSDPWIIIF